MDGETLNRIRSILMEKKVRMSRAAYVDASESPPEDTVSAEVIDIAQALEQLGRDTTLKEAERRGLAAIDRALAKMATGKFGVCEDCEDDIPAKRLLVVPEARLCANCQMFEERQNSKLNPRAKVA